MAKAPLGVAILEEMNQRAQTTLEGKVLIWNRSRQDASVNRTWAFASFAAGAGNTSQLKQIRDVGALIQSLDATQDNKNLVIDLAYVRYELSCADAFHFVPILVLCENGETVTTISGTESDPKVDLDSGVAGIFSHKVGTPCVSRKIRDNDANYWLTRITHNITAECKKYTKAMIRDLLDEQTVKELFTAGHSVTQSAEQTVAVNELFVMHYHLEESKIANL